MTLVEPILAKIGLEEMTNYILFYAFPTLQIAVIVLFLALTIILAKFGAPRILTATYILLIGTTLTYIAFVKSISLSIIVVIIAAVVLVYVYLWRAG